VNHEIFTLSSNRTTKFADWVSYTVESSNISGPTRSRNWKKDPSIPDQDTLSPNDYAEAITACGYDRGHQAPLASFSNNTSWANSNYLSNITPQMAELNQGSWGRLEDAERKLSLKYSKVYVVTGPYYTGETMCTLPKSAIPVVIPNGYWKVISIVDRSGNSQPVSFMFKQDTPRNAKYCDNMTDLNSIKAKTKLDILPIRYDLNNSELVADLGCAVKNN
jgi:endonuclease G